MASVAIRDVNKAFGTPQVIHGVNITIDDGAFVVLVGRRDSANPTSSSGRQGQPQADPSLMHLFDEATGKRLNA